MRIITGLGKKSQRVEAGTCPTAFVELDLSHGRGGLADTSSDNSQFTDQR